ncbi:MAG: type II toxin-antitoxin system RelB/DinJ family antitoxin [Candidatus Magasanikbacteria bacterium]
MKSAMITLKIDPKTKKEAKQVAEDLGFSLSSLLNGFLKDLIYNREINFSRKEEPSDYLIEAIREAEEERKKGNYYSFEDSQKAIDFLDDLIAEDEKK